MVMQERAKSAARASGRECNHAEDFCRHGDPDACEFLGEACGFSEDQIASIMGASEEPELPEDADDLPGPVYRALSGAWTGYTIGIQRAKQYARAINRIHDEHDLEPVAFEELGGRVFEEETAE